jgi:hypothetical protein
VPPPAQPQVEFEGVTEVPEDYYPAKGEAPAVPTAAAAGPETLRREVSVQELRQVEQDPVVRQTMELFDGILLHVERRSAGDAQPMAE